MRAHALGVVTDGATLLGVVAALPFVMLAVGLPLVLVLQLLLWLVRLVT